MDKKELFLNLMQEQKQICKKCYLWDNDGCYCASDGRNTEVCEFFNRIDALYSNESIFIMLRDQMYNRALIQIHLQAILKEMK